LQHRVAACPTARSARPNARRYRRQPDRAIPGTRRRLAVLLLRHVPAGTNCSDAVRRDAASKAAGDGPTAASGIAGAESGGEITCGSLRKGAKPQRWSEGSPLDVYGLVLILRRACESNRVLAIRHICTEYRIPSHLSVFHA